jgi:hypothetical protein
MITAVFFLLGVVSGVAGIYLILHPQKLDFMAPIVGMFLMGGFIIPVVYVATWMGFDT